VGSSQVVDVVATIFFLLTPESQILFQKLNDALGVTEVIFLEFIDLVKGILEGLVGEVASGLVVLHHLVVEDREVKGETQADGVAGGKVDLIGLVVCLKCTLLDILEVSTLGVFSDVTVVIADHLHEESLGLTVAGLGEHMLVNQVYNVLAVLLELCLN